MSRPFKSLIVYALLLGLVGCYRKSAEQTQTYRSGRPKIVCTTGMVGDLVKRVVGNDAEVVTLMGESTDPHLYVPTSDDVRALRNADVVFFSGLGLEGRMEDVLRSISSKSKPVRGIADDLPEERLRKEPEFGSHPDPHVWMDPMLWSECVAVVEEVMTAHDSAHSTEYRENAKQIRSELAALDVWIRKAMQSVPEGSRYLVTAHDAFGYFSRAYAIPVRSVQGVTTDSEPGLKDIQDLIRFVVENKVRAIFMETSVSEKNLKSIVEGAQAAGWNVALGQPLYSDAMGPSGSYEGTYIGMLDHNVCAIVNALGGTAKPFAQRERSSGESSKRVAQGM